MRRVVAVVAGLGAALVAAIYGCSGGSFTAADAGSDGAVDGTVTPDGSGRDSPGLEAAPEAASEAGNPGDAGVLGCDAQADATVFCDNFDEGPPVGMAWSGQIGVSPSTLVLDGDASVSPPYSLLAELLAVDAAPAAFAAVALYKDFPGNVKTLTCSCDLLVKVDTGPVYAAQVLRVELPSTNVTPADYSLSVELQHGATSLNVLREYGPRFVDGGELDVPVSVPSGWSHAVFAVTLNGAGTGHVTLTWGGSVVANNVPLTPPPAVYHARWFAGIPAATSGGGSTFDSRVNVDNVQCVVTY